MSTTNSIQRAVRYALSSSAVPITAAQESFMFVRKSRSLACALGIVGALVARSVLASGFQIKENSAQALGRAFAGSGAAPGDLTVVANNPAAMSLLDGTAVQADLSLIDLSIDFDGAGRDALGRPLTGGDGGDGGDLNAVPAAYFSTPFGDGWRFGASLTAPFGLKTEYDAGWVGRYQALKSELKTIDLGLALSYDLTDRFSLGGSLIYHYADAELSQAVDFGAVLATNPALPLGTFLPQSADGKSTLTGDNTAWGWSLGALWRISDGTDLGLTYRSRIEHTLEGDIDYEVPANVADVFALGGVTRFDDTGGRADLDTPAVTTLSLYHAATERLALMADVALTEWSAFEEIRVRSDNGAPDSVDAQNWRDTWFASVGADYRLNDTLTLRGGLGYDQTPTRDEHRSPRIPDTERRWLSLGLTWRTGANTALNFGYTHLFTDEAEIGNRSSTGSTLNGFVDSGTDLYAASLSYTF
jgi:long-chain fatty acid transport protein